MSDTKYLLDESRIPHKGSLEDKDYDEKLLEQALGELPDVAAG